MNKPGHVLYGLTHEACRGLCFFASFLLPTLSTAKTGLNHISSPAGEILYSAVASGNANLRDVALGCPLPQKHTTNSFRRVNTIGTDSEAFS